MNTNNEHIKYKVGTNVKFIGNSNQYTFVGKIIKIEDSMYAIETSSNNLHHVHLDKIVGRVSFFKIYFAELVVAFLLSAVIALGVFFIFKSTQISLN